MIVLGAVLAWVHVRSPGPAISRGELPAVKRFLAALPVAALAGLAGWTGYYALPPVGLTGQLEDLAGLSAILFGAMAGTLAGFGYTITFPRWVASRFWPIEGFLGITGFGMLGMMVAPI